MRWTQNQSLPKSEDPNDIGMTLYDVDMETLKQMINNPDFGL